MASDWGHQLRWWAGEYRRRGIDAAVRVAPTATRTTLMTAIERRDGGFEIDLGNPGPYRNAIVVDEKVVDPPMTHIVPGVADHPRTEGYHWSDRSVFRLRGCQVDVQTGLVFHDGKVLTASGNGWHSARDAALLSGAGARSARANARWSGPITPLGRTHNYCHFLIESFPRFLHAQALVPDTIPVFSGPMPSYVADVLKTLGVRYRLVDELDVVACDDVVLCEPVPTNWPHPTDYPLLRSVTEAAVPVSPGSGPERVYITRRHASRTIRDEPLVEQAMQERGFTVVAMEKLSFADQLHTIRDARVIVAPHGTGLANAIFCQPGTVIYEVTAGHWWNPSFRHMASICGNPHRLVQIPATDEHPYGNAPDAIAALDAAFAAPPTLSASLVP